MTINLDDYKYLESVPGFLKIVEGYALLTWAATWPVAGDIVELGSFKGRSTVFLGAGACISNKLVHAIDHFRGSEEHRAQGMSHESTLDYGASLYPQFRMNILRCGLQAQIVSHISSHAELASEFPDGGVSILFIDGEHDYESTKRNYEAWLPTVAEGGLILFHDDDEFHPDVQRAVGEVPFERLPNEHSIAAFVNGRIAKVTPAGRAALADSPDPG